LVAEHGGIDVSYEQQRRLATREGSGMRIAALYIVTCSEYMASNDMISIYLLTAIGSSPGDSSTVHIYTQTIYRTIQNKQYIEQ